MASDVDIANVGLSKIGGKAITAFAEETVSGRLVNLTYNGLRDAVLRDHFWNFAMRRASLAASTTSPEWGFSNAFDLPSEPNYCLRVKNVNNAFDDQWKVEGRQIVTDLSAPLQILYIQRVTDSEQFDSLFVETLAQFCAAEWAEKLTSSTTLRTQMTQLYSAKLQQARSMDGQEGTTDDLEASEWINARL